MTVAGAFLGFVYLFVMGYALGRLIGVVYNFGSAPQFMTADLFRWAQ